MIADNKEGCVDHWHCVPREAGHMCNRPDRTTPCPTCDEAPAIALTEEDLRRIDTLALDRPHVLAALAKLVGVHLETVNPERVRWYATPKDGGTFSGTLAEVGAYVRGYATAYASSRIHEGRPQQKGTR